MLWINFLHLYQPANSENFAIKEAIEKSYLRITRGLEEHPNIKFTLNIAGCLIVRLNEMGERDLLDRIKRLIQKGQIELVGSAAYHPLLPLISKKEVVKQIVENEEIIKNFFGIKPVGFFFPEMAYGPEVAKIVKRLGYEWIIIDEISLGGKLNQVDQEIRYVDKNSGLKVLFRDRQASSSFVPELILNDIKNNRAKEKYITATDAELYGLRHIDHDAKFEELLKNSQLLTKTMSEYMKSLAGSQKEIVLVKSTWESSEIELKNKQPYSLWQNNQNEIHGKIWELANLAYKVVEKNRNHPNYYWGRWHLVRGLASCTFWWASQKDFENVYGPYAWSPDEINKRINEYLKAIRTFEDKTSLNTKIKAEKLALDIVGMVWQKHWRMKHAKFIKSK